MESTYPSQGVNPPPVNLRPIKSRDGKVSIEQARPSLYSPPGKHRGEGWGSPKQLTSNEFCGINAISKVNPMSSSSHQRPQRPITTRLFSEGASRMFKRGMVEGQTRTMADGKWERDFLYLGPEEGEEMFRAGELVRVRFGEADWMERERMIPTILQAQGQVTFTPRTLPAQPEVTMGRVIRPPSRGKNRSASHGDGDNAYTVELLTPDAPANEVWALAEDEMEKATPEDVAREMAR